MNETRTTSETCGCCEDEQDTLTLANRPGLQTLAYRVGTHASFKQAMSSRIAQQETLRALTTRDDSDFTIGLIDAWATVCDVLSFYTERIANEGQLRTATERISVQTLARSIGYAPHPGIAASTYLAFKVEDAPGAPANMPIPAGTRAQSLPDGDALPQTFETLPAFIAHPEWNALRPRRHEPQHPSQDTRVFWIEGTSTGLSIGDFMLLRAGEAPGQTGVLDSIPLQVLAVEPDQSLDHTRVETTRPGAETPTTTLPPAFEFGGLPPPPPPPPGVFTGNVTFSGSSASALASDFTWSAADTEVFALMQFDATALFASYVNHAVATPTTEDATLYALRAKSAPFGHNAPRYDTLPAEWIHLDASHLDDETSEPDDSPDEQEPPYPRHWDNSPLQVNQASNGTSYREAIYNAPDQDEEVILLDAEFPEVLPESWILLKSTSATPRYAAFQVTRSDTISRADFALNGKVSALTLREADAEQTPIALFRFRSTTIFAQSEALSLAGAPIETPIEGDSIELDHMLESQIHPGQPIIVSGTPTDIEGLVENELPIVREAIHQGGHTRLVFEEPLTRAYRRDSVRLNANVAPATHGETREEVLGGGDASKPFQTFTLSQPLTYVSAPVPGGAESTLALRVNGRLWREAPHFFDLAPEARRFVSSRDEQEKTTLTFGDGSTGGRLPTGFDNVTARYRTGLGLAGNLAAGKINMLGSQPRFVQGVTNPLPATGGVDPETETDTRRQAPASVKTFGRIVSLSDFEDFALDFGGIAKARADLLPAVEGELVHLTLAGAEGAPIEEASALFQDLLAAMSRVRDLSVRLVLSSYELRLFDIVAKIRVHEDFQSAPVFAAAEAALREVFSFERRALGRDVGLGEVVAVLQSTRGVVAVDLDRLRFSHESNDATPLLSRLKLSVPTRLRALPARRVSATRLSPAQHLSIKGVELLEMT
jgi:predicted phage baseplate assembly protein